MSRVVLLPLLAALALTGCAGGRSGGASRPQADLATQHACRQRVNEVYDERNRAEVFRANSTMNSPFSSDYQVGLSNRGLSEQFSYGKMQSDCESNALSDDQPTIAPAR